MRKSMNRLLALVLALSLLLSLTACGESSTATGNPTTAASSSETAGTGAAEQPTQGESEDVTRYNGLFDTTWVHTIDVTISEADWADLQANPLEKTKYKTTVTVDGEAVEEVSFATKGNTSLSSVASDPDSNRYSFKLNFGKYNKSQTYHGLDKLSLNNLYADATCLKDYLSYEIFRQAGVDAPLASFVWLTINGEDHGLYLALEDVGESWLDRTNDGEGEIYKPETDMLDNIAQGPGGDGENRPGREGGDNGNFPGGNGQGFPGGQGGENGGFPEFGGENSESSSGGGDGETPTTPADNGQGGQPNGQGFPGGNGQGGNPDASSGGDPNGQGGQPNGQGFPGGNGQGGNPDASSGGDGNASSGGEGEGNPGGFPGGEGQGFPGGMFSMGANGADLAYTDDELSSYSDIFDNAETKTTEEDEARVVASLKGLSQGENLEQYLDTDEIIRYFAAHNFVLNYDSYTGTMLHNYYLLERDGKLSMLPWDYNLGFGGFSGVGSDATELINTGIDSPLSGTTEDSRPMWNWIVNNETYLEQYHQVYDSLLTNYFESGEFEAQLDAVYALIRPYVEKDPTAFFTVEEFDTAVATLKSFCLRRAQSIRAQLEGSLATRTNEQDREARIDASDIQVSTMGSQNNNNDQGGFPGGKTGRKK